MKIISAMLRYYGLLHPSQRYNRAVAWEMDLDTLKLIAGALTPEFDVEEIELIEPQCLGLRVHVVDRPGVRLVITVVDR